MKPIKHSTPEEILNNFGPVERAKAPDFFYTRLKARMERELTPAKPASWVLRPAYALAGLIVILVINIVVLINKESAQSNTPITGTISVIESESMQSLASEFSLNDNSALADLNSDSK